MKRIVLVISLLFISYFSFSQKGYGGLIYDKNASSAFIRPYVIAKLSEKDFGGGLSYSPIVGAGMNTLGNISAQLGFDLYQSLNDNDNIRLLAGFGVELLGWQEVHQEYMPNLRFGFETKKWILLGTTNYTFKPIYVFGERLLEPTIKPTFGLFYKIR